jgi:acetyl esterase/lipase
LATELISPPQVRLGALAEGGLAPAILAIVERGVIRRPALAGAMRTEVQLEYDEGYPPVRVVFAGDHVLVEDGPATAPDLRVSGPLPDLVSLMMVPHFGGLPNPAAARGRAALGMIVLRRVRIQGRLGLLRRLLRIIAV